MNIKNILEEIDNDVLDVYQTNFVHNATEIVPGIEDNGLTYERGVEKKGKTIKTCILYADIRNSVALTEKHHSQTMGKIYTAFTKAVLKIARHHNGHTRNIIGDRVMIVFPTDNCFTNAVDCAISINYIATYIIKKHFSLVDFKCGIGIDYGDIKVIKVGIQRHGTENPENKGLVWVGYPANIASRLTDVANKTIQEPYFEVVRNPINPRAIKPVFDVGLLLNSKPSYDPSVPYYSTYTETVKMSIEEFVKNIKSFEDGGFYMKGGKVIKFSKKIKFISYPAILMTNEVYVGFKKQNPKNNSIINNYWTEQLHKIKSVNGKVFGGNIIWNLNQTKK